MRKQEVAPAPITYEQAYEVICEHYRSIREQWTHGTFCIDDREIIENEEIFVFRVGAREWLIDRDRSYLLLGGSAKVVYKADGRFAQLPGVVVGPDSTIRRRPNPNPRLVV
ncbi:hypothetical protein ACFXO9_21140 [Nocardia tengchongensis]|uniref:hypothetical protein n=1 Tax=Nocardia tengchongensis TaxID=2055889 RepID=UPI003682A038